MLYGFDFLKDLVYDAMNNLPLNVRLVPSPPSRSHVFYSMSLHVDDHVTLAAKARRRTGNSLE